MKMMRLIIKYYQQICLLFVALLFSDCSFNDPYYFIESENYYYFNKGDTLRYISKSRIDSFVVVNSELSDDHGKYERFNIHVRQINKVNSVYDGGFMFFFSDYNYRISFRNITYEDRSIDYSDYVLLDSLNVLQTDYGYTYFYEKNYKYAVELLDSNVSCIYYNYNYGLIKYELKSGETFTIDEELLRR